MSNAQILGPFLGRCLQGGEGPWIRPLEWVATLQLQFVGCIPRHQRTFDVWPDLGSLNVYEKRWKITLKRRTAIRHT